MCSVRIPCNGAVDCGSLGASYVAADWQVRVFGLSGIVNIPYGHLSVSNISYVWVHGHIIEFKRIYLTMVDILRTDNFKCFFWQE